MTDTAEFDAENEKSSRHWTSLRLVFLLAIISVICIYLAFRVLPPFRNQNLVKQIESYGGKVQTEVGDISLTLFSVGPKY